MGDDWKPEKVNASALIPVGGTNFAAMTDASQIDSWRMSAPAIHGSIDRGLKIQAAHSARGEYADVPSVIKPQEKKFGNGAQVVNKQGKKLTIIQANAGHTRKSHTPVHKVANRHGDVSLEKQTDLKLIY